MQKALQLWGRHTVQIQTADAHSVLAIAYNFMGNFALAEHHLSCAISCCDQLHDEKGKINNLIRMATSKQRQGAYADAETILTQILSEPTASILLQQKRYDEARIFFSALETSLKATGLKRELLRVKVRLAMCYLTGGGATDGRDRLHPGNAGLRAACAHGDTTLSHAHQFVKTQAELEHLRSQLHIEAVAKKTREAAPVAALATPAAPTPVLKGTNQPAISIQAFGEPAVFLDERPITRWRMARAMELFFFLLDAGRPMRKEQILTALWPQVDDQINQTFHSTIHYLRKALNDTYVISRGGTYGLDLPSSDGNRFHYDVAQFKDLHVNEREGKDLKLHVINDAAQEKQLELVREWSSLFRLCLCQTLPRKRKRLLHSYKWRASQWELSLHPDADRSRPGWTECLPLPHKRADTVHQRDVFAFSTPSVNSTRRHHQGSWHR